MTVEQELRITDLVRVRLGPDDVLVVHVGEGWPKKGIEDAQERLRELFPDNRCLVVGPDVSLEVVNVASG